MSASAPDLLHVDASNASVAKGVSARSDKSCSSGLVRSAIRYSASWHMLSQSLFVRYTRRYELCVVSYAVETTGTAPRDTYATYEETRITKIESACILALVQLQQSAGSPRLIHSFKFYFKRSISKKYLVRTHPPQRTRPPQTRDRPIVTPKPALKPATTHPLPAWSVSS